MITGINHLTLSVSSIEESFDFYTTILTFKPLARWPKGAYLLAGNLWIALVVDENTRSKPLAEYSHIAFSVSPENFLKLRQRIQEFGAKIWQENWTEGDSVYFCDPNGHKLEIHSSDLAARLKSAREKPWEGLIFYE